MARQVVTTTEYFDDLDGSKADGTVSFGYDGVSYEIDLSKANMRAFEKTMALYVGHARKSRGSRGRATGKQRAAGGRYDLTAVRAWAADNGFEVAPRGRVAAQILEAYDAAH